MDLKGLVKPSDAEVALAAKSIPGLTTKHGAGKLYTNGEGKISAVAPDEVMGGWEYLGSINGATKTLAAKRINELLSKITW